MVFRSDRRRGGTLVLVAAAVVMALLAVRSFAFPMYDAAFFEYVGRAIARGGHTLYRDVWDNKLPSIFAVNALWQMLFGDHYALHIAAETALDVVSVVLFARILAADGVVDWAPPAALLGIGLGVLNYGNDTEHYALTLILAGVLAARTGRYVWSGIAIALAATFWIPAILTVAAPLAEGRDRRGVVVIAAACTGIAYAAACVGAFGAPACVELVASWTNYVGRESLAARFHDIRDYLPKLAVAFAFVLPGFAVVRALRTPRGRFAAAWFIAALAGALLPMRPWVHYFIPALAPSLYAMLAGGVRLDLRRAGAAAAALVALLLLGTAHHVRSERDPDLTSKRIGTLLRARLPAGSTIATDVYQPGIFLAADAPLVDRFQLTYDWNAPFVAHLTGLDPLQLRARYIGAASAVVVSGSPASVPELDRFRPVCAAAAAPWRLYVRPKLAAAFGDC